jgi:predicted amidohydrolase YtcJ
MLFTCGVLPAACALTACESRPRDAERVDLATMIDAYTINGAYTIKLEDRQGSIEVGKRADLVVLDRNLFEIDPYEISDANVTMTVFDGRTVYPGPE